MISMLNLYIKKEPYIFSVTFYQVNKSLGYMISMLNLYIYQSLTFFSVSVLTKLTKLSRIYDLDAQLAYWKEPYIFCNCFLTRWTKLSRIYDLDAQLVY
jgi:hypothetical protein